MTPPTQIYRTCKQIKPLDEFHRANDRPSGHRGQCKACNKQARKEFYQQHPGYISIESRRKLYKLSQEDYLKMLETQQSKCFICKEEKKLHVDHDHTTQKVRAHICQDCNFMLGHANDDILILAAAIEYLNFLTTLKKIAISARSASEVRFVSMFTIKNAVGVVKQNLLGSSPKTKEDLTTIAHHVSHAGKHQKAGFWRGILSTLKWSHGRGDIG